MKRVSVLLLVGLLALAGCGGDNDDTDSADRAADESAAAESARDREATKTKDRDRGRNRVAGGTGTSVVLGDSEFGRMLFNSKKQAIYIFERDGKDRSNCYGECAEAWPPVFTEGRPRAGKGVERSLLGTTKRRDGKLQVTYAGQPLYYYAHEEAGEVKCHNVNLNGGFWWVVGADGDRLQ